MCKTIRVEPADADTRSRGKKWVPIISLATPTKTFIIFLSYSLTLTVTFSKEVEEDCSQKQQPTDHYYYVFNSACKTSPFCTYYNDRLCLIPNRAVKVAKLIFV